MVDLDLKDFPGERQEKKVLDRVLRRTSENLSREIQLCYAQVMDIMCTNLLVDLF